MSRPAHIPGKPGFFTAEQVKAWRAEYRERMEIREKLKDLRTLEDMAKEAGTTRNVMRSLIAFETYKWVR